MLMLLLPEVNKTYHCVCVSRWSRTGKNSPGEWTGELLWSIWREVFRGKREGKETILALWKSWVLPF